jgi:hypothetical protein
LFADDARVLLLFAFEPPLPRVVVFVVGFRLRGEEFFEWCRRSSSSLLVSLKSFSVVLSSKDKFRTPSLKEVEGAFEFVPPILVLFFSFSRGILRFFLERFEGSFVSNERKKERTRSERARVFSMQTYKCKK